MCYTSFLHIYKDRDKTEVCWPKLGTVISSDHIGNKMLKLEQARYINHFFSFRINFANHFNQHLLKKSVNINTKNTHIYKRNQTNIYMTS